MLVIGYGNPGRCDDGLGPAFASRLLQRGLSGVTVSSDYQLSVDHALMIASADRVVFVDAFMGVDCPYRFNSVEPKASHDLASHSLVPSAVLALAATLFGAKPDAYVLGISGVEFGKVREGLSADALANLDLAEEFFLEWVANQEHAPQAEGFANA